MAETKLILNEYETEALKRSLDKYIKVIDDQINELKNTKHSSNEIKKKIQRKLTKRSNLLSDILKRL